MTATLPFARPAPGRAPAAPDIAFAALPLLRRLRDALRLAARFRDGVRRLEAKRNQWGVPRLFFFDRDLQAEWNAVRPQERPRDNDAALADLADDALTVLSACLLTRRAARAVTGLADAAAGLAADHPRARELVDLLALPEDEVFLVIHPTARAGFRVTTRGVADVYQFHALLADAVTGDPGRGLLPGPRPDPRVLAAYRDQPHDSDVAVAAARFQFFRPSALRADGTLPSGFAGSDDWLWGREPLASVPRVGGERIMLIGEPAFRETWEAARRLPRVNGELDVIEVLSAAAVAEWVAKQTGRPVETGEEMGRRAA